MCQGVEQQEGSSVGVAEVPTLVAAFFQILDDLSPNMVDPLGVVATCLLVCTVWPDNEYTYRDCAKASIYQWASTSPLYAEPDKHVRPGSIKLAGKLGGNMTAQSPYIDIPRLVEKLDEKISLCRVQVQLYVFEKIHGKLLRRRRSGFTEEPDFAMFLAERRADSPWLQRRIPIIGSVGVTNRLWSPFAAI